MMYWILNLLVFSGIVYTAFKFFRNDFGHWLFYGALLFRVLAGLMAATIFLHVYPSNDSISFFEMSKSLLNQHSLWEIFSLEKPEFTAGSSPRVIFFVKILSFFTHISGGSYWIVTLYFSLISFISSWLFVREIAKLFPDLKTIIIISFLFIPSIAFWSSGILKDTLSFAALLLATSSILKTSTSRRLKISEVILTVLSLLILFNLKHYLLITVLIFGGLTLCIYFFRKTNGSVRWASFLILIVPFIATQFIHPYLKVNRIAQTIYENNQVILKKTAPESRVGIVLENSEWSTIIDNSPKALFTSLFRPTFFDRTPSLGLIHKFENLVLLSLCIFSILLFVKKKPRLDWNLLAPAFLSIAMLAVLLALTTPNLGTLVRYKNVLMPFLFLISSVLPYQYLTSKKEG